VPDQTFYSRGKLMLTGEYLVMQGAQSLSVPVKLGQSMKISRQSSSEKIFWHTTVMDKPWFEGTFHIHNFSPIQYNNEQSAHFIKALLIAARSLNPDFCNHKNGYDVECNIEFDVRWGFGSSSSLISNVACWASVDPLKLHAQVSRGSGYDVACARADGPIVFQISKNAPIISEVDFFPAFRDKLFFIYLGEKKDSQSAVEKFLLTKKDYPAEVAHVSIITQKMISCRDEAAFGNLLDEHESVMEKVLGVPSLKKSRFSDFPGIIKSLGAWGGDFALALWPCSPDELFTYLSCKNLPISFKFNDLVYDKRENTHK
jgi:mevalonate kinase